jgi:hypothetical protein
MAFFKKAAGKSPGFHNYTNADMKRVQWCLDRKIKIAVIPNGVNWQVEITIGKSVNLDSTIYRAKEAYIKMYEYYKYYYDKHNKQ